MRHASSPPGPDDHTRPLDAQGITQAHEIGNALAARDAAPGAALCSSAQRAVQTLETLGAHISLPAAEVEPQLYLASRSVLRARIASLDAGIPSALLVGHNPGLGELVAELGREGERETLARSRHFPPATLAILAFDTAHWAELAHASGRVLAVLQGRT